MKMMMKMMMKRMKTIMIMMCDDFLIKFSLILGPKIDDVGEVLGIQNCMVLELQKGRLLEVLPGAIFEGCP